MERIVNLKPIFDSLVIEKFETKKVTDSGFTIPESAQKMNNLAKVVAIGPNCKSEIKVGDYVVIPKNLQITTDVEVNGKMQSIIKEENIIAIVSIESV